MGNNHRPRKVMKAANSLQEECIRVPKVYDWVTDQLTVSKSVRFDHDQLEAIEDAMRDPSRRPLRIVCKTPTTPPLFPLNQSDPRLIEERGFFCEQVGEKQNVTVPVGGEFVDAQLVDLLFNADVKIQVLDRHGEVVTERKVDVAAMESFVLCFPEGTDLLCRVSKIFCRISTGSLLLNNPAPESFKLEVTFCVDVQVEAEVKLEVLAKFCSPRENNITAPEVINQCPPIEFPAQCPGIFPQKNCDCEAMGEASGQTGSHATEQGEAGINLHICPNCSLTNSEFEFTFDDRETSDGLKNIFFTATSFDPETLVCKPSDDGLKLIVSGEGVTDDGRRLDFNLAVLDSPDGDKFHVQLIRENTGKVVFDTGVVNVTHGRLTVEDCVTFENIKYK
ncbi:MAG: hypothetical protein ACO1OT_18935 [Heyndrickxia sp.]